MIIRTHGLGKSKTSWVGKIDLRHGPWVECICCLKPFVFVHPPDLGEGTDCAKIWKMQG